MNALIPIWIIGGPFIGIVLLGYAFKGPSAMGGHASRSIRDDDPYPPGDPRRA